MAEETQKLTAALAAGDEDAVETFYRRYFDWLYSQARRATGGRDEAFCLDVVQDSLLRIIRTVRPVAEEKQFRPWLRLVVQTTACDRLRSETRRQRHELAAVAVRGGDEQPDVVDADDQIQWLREQIEKLDPRIVQMIEWRFEQRWTLARISEKVGLSIGTIDGRLRRALSELRERAIEEFDD